jgi:ABC-2 type transport system ATP-binding protein
MNDLAALQTDGLGKRYRSQWALRDCTLEIPSRSVTALVGPNGAGKTTLLQLAVGLIPPSAGEVRVLGLSPREEAISVLPRVGFVAQDHPLHRGFTVRETLTLGRKLNPSWDEHSAWERIKQLGLPPEKKIRELSGASRPRSHSRSRSPRDRTCCCSMSRWPR